MGRGTQQMTGWLVLDITYICQELPLEPIFASF